MEELERLALRFAGWAALPLRTRVDLRDHLDLDYRLALAAYDAYVDVHHEAKRPLLRETLEMLAQRRQLNFIMTTERQREFTAMAEMARAVAADQAVAEVE